VLASVTEQNHSRFRTAVRQVNGNDVAEFNERSVVVFHRNGPCLSTNPTLAGDGGHGRLDCNRDAAARYDAWLDGVFILVKTPAIESHATAHWYFPRQLNRSECDDIHA
jgi:hypothetical protein